SRRRHTRSTRDWSSDVCSSDLSAEVGNASPESPLILGILRGVEVMSKVLELQETYLDLVRPLVRHQKNTQRGTPVANAAYASFEDRKSGRVGDEGRSRWSAVGA